MRLVEVMCDAVALERRDLGELLVAGDAHVELLLRVTRLQVFVQVQPAEGATCSESEK